VSILRPAQSGHRATALRTLAEAIIRIDLRHHIRVAIDGPDAAGKTTLGDELAALIQATGRPVIRASVDGFHRPRVARLTRGTESPEGYYRDSFDYPALHEVLLTPLGPGGHRRYRRAVFDHPTDSPLPYATEYAPHDAVLLFDGVFLLRPELIDAWDFRIFVTVPFEETVRRAVLRDRDLFGSEAIVRQRYAERYLPGQRIYLEEVRPESLADVMVDNADPQAPQLRWASAADHRRRGEKASR